MTRFEERHGVAGALPSEWGLGAVKAPMSVDHDNRDKETNTCCDCRFCC